MNTSIARPEWQAPVLVDLSTPHTHSGDTAPKETTQSPGGGTGFAFGPNTTPGGS